MAVVEQIKCDLRYRRGVYETVRGELVRRPEKDETVPAIPPQFEPMEGPYGAVARVAVRLNDAQLRSGFLHYLFFPEPVGAGQVVV